jgi:hypothetical protein
MSIEGQKRLRESFMRVQHTEQTGESYADPNHVPVSKVDWGMFFPSISCIFDYYTDLDHACSDFWGSVISGRVLMQSLLDLSPLMPIMFVRLPGLCF